ELARVVGQEIVLRDPIRFAVGTARILPESLPTLDQVAGLVAPGTLLVIEGHSSEEGDYSYNYTLSLERAKSIWERLIQAGVPPFRLAYRGVGEVDPVAGGEGEVGRAANRRVIFHLVHLEGLAEPPGDVVLP